MELMNALAKFEVKTSEDRAVAQEVLELMVLMLSPIVPHASHALWQALGHDEAIIDVSWPRIDETALVQDSVEIVVQINGKLRGRVTVSASASEADARDAALGDVQIQKWIEGKPLRKVIYVPGKLLNLVV
jgi:leucyl-tRNA synthetase